MNREETKLLISAVDRVDKRLENVEREIAAVKSDVSKLKSFKLQVVAWGTGAATTLGVLFPKALEWVNNSPKN